MSVRVKSMSTRAIRTTPQLNELCKRGADARAILMCARARTFAKSRYLDGTEPRSLLVDNGVVTVREPNCCLWARKGIAVCHWRRSFLTEDTQSR
jgi:hypothetical protein